jgi:hypothetical protein
MAQAGSHEQSDPHPQIIVLAPVNGETFSSLPIVMSYRITGVDVVEVFCDGTLKWQYEQMRDDDTAVTALLMNPPDAGGLFISGMHSIVISGKMRGVEGTATGHRIDFFMDMPTAAYMNHVSPPPLDTPPHPHHALLDETGIASVLLIGNFRPPPAGDESECLAGQYKMALRKLGIFVHARQEDFSDGKILQTTVFTHKPDLVLYIPETELMHGTSDLSILWKSCHDLGITTAVVLPHLHNGFALDTTDVLWHAQYVLSGDPAALSKWPHVQNRAQQASNHSGHAGQDRLEHGELTSQHIWLPPAASMAGVPPPPPSPLPSASSLCLCLFLCLHLLVPGGGVWHTSVRQTRMYGTQAYARLA